MEDYSNQNGHSGYDPKYNPQSYGPNYDYGSYGNDPYGEGGPNKSVKGLKIMIVIMALILAALSAIYFLQVKQMKDDFAIERDTLTRQLTSLMNDYDTLKTMNDTLGLPEAGSPGIPGGYPDPPGSGQVRSGGGRQSNEKRQGVHHPEALSVRGNR